MKFRLSLFPFALFALIRGAAVAEPANAATYMLIDGLTASASSPNIVHPGLVGMQSFKAAAGYASGRTPYDPPLDRDKRIKRARHRNGSSASFVAPGSQLAPIASWSFVSIATSGNTDFVKAVTLPDQQRSTESSRPAKAPGGEDAPSRYLMLAAGVLALGLAGWRRSRIATSL